MFNRKDVGIYFNHELMFIKASTQIPPSILMGAALLAPDHYLPMDVDNSILGQTVKQALSESRTELAGPPSGHPDAAPMWQATFKAALKKFGYRTEKEFYTYILQAFVDVTKGTFTIWPMQQYKLRYFWGQPPLNIELPEEVSDAELGAAIKEGFSRCKPYVPPPKVEKKPRKTIR